METEKVLLLCIMLILCVSAVCSVIIMGGFKTETQLNILSSSSLHDGESIIVQLTDKNGTPLPNEQINLTLIDMDGQRKTLNINTDYEGKAAFVLDNVMVGNYILECVFGGDGEYEKSIMTSSFEVKEIEPYIIDTKTVCGGSKICFYSDGTFKSYHKDGSFDRSGYATPDNFIG